jgi:MFS family permease
MPLYSLRFVLVLASQFVFGLGFSSFFLLPKYLSEVHQADAACIGRVMAMGPVAAVLAVPLLARRIDRTRRHYLMLLAALLMLAASAGFLFLGELEPGVYLLRLLQGAAFTIYMSSAATLIAEMAPAARLAQALGLLGAANLATNAIGPAVAEPLAAHAGWRAVFVLSGACSLLAAVATPALREPVRSALLRAATPTLREPRRAAALYASIVVGISFGTIVTFYQPLALSIGISQVSDLFIGYTLSALAVRVIFGVWLDRFDRRRLAVVATSAYACVVLATAALRSGWLLPLGLSLGLAHGALYPVLTALFIEGSDPRARGALMTYFGGAFNIGMVLSTLGFGVLADWVGYRLVFLIAGSLAISAAPILARTRSRPSEPAASA